MRSEARLVVGHQNWHDPCGARPIDLGRGQQQELGRDNPFGKVAGKVAEGQYLREGFFGLFL